MFPGRPIVRPVPRPVLRPPSPVRPSQPQQASMRGIGPQSTSPQRLSGQRHQQQVPTTGSSWQRPALTRGTVRPQVSTTGSGWRQPVLAQGAGQQQTSSTGNGWRQLAEAQGARQQSFVADNTRQTVERFVALGQEAQGSLSEEYDLAQVEPLFLEMLNMVKANLHLKDHFSKLFIEALTADTLPLEAVQFCMRELQWEEVRAAAALGIEQSDDPRVKRSLGSVSEVYDKDWDDSDMYEHYSSQQ